MDVVGAGGAMKEGMGGWCVPMENMEVPSMADRPTLTMSTGSLSCVH